MEGHSESRDPAVQHSVSSHKDRAIVDQLWVLRLKNLVIIIPGSR